MTTARNLRRSASLCLVLILALGCAPPARALNWVAGWNHVPIRGLAQDVYYLAPAPGVAVKTTVLFLPGDGGWRGLAPDLAEELASRGYTVYGFDTKHYLTSFTSANKHLTSRDMSRDLHRLMREIAPNRRLVLVGWSQGAAMAVLAAHGRYGHRNTLGVLAISTPEEAALGWSWMDTLLSPFRKKAGQPHFKVAGELKRVAPVPLYLIHPSEDRFTTLEGEYALYHAAVSPKAIRIVCGADHSYGDDRAALWAALEDGISWISAPHPANIPPLAKAAAICP